MWMSTGRISIFRSRIRPGARRMLWVFAAADPTSSAHNLIRQPGVLWISISAAGATSHDRDLVLSFGAARPGRRAAGPGGKIAGPGLAGRDQNRQRGTLRRARQSFMDL